MREYGVGGRPCLQSGPLGCPSGAVRLVLSEREREGLVNGAFCEAVETLAVQTVEKALHIGSFLVGYPLPRQTAQLREPGRDPLSPPLTPNLKIFQKNQLCNSN